MSFRYCFVEVLSNWSTDNNVLARGSSVLGGVTVDHERLLHSRRQGFGSFFTIQKKNKPKNATAA